MTTPVDGLRTTVEELGVPAFLRVVWYGMWRVEAPAAATNKSTGPIANIETTESMAARFR